jgi:hypothetical protein
MRRDPETPAFSPSRKPLRMLPCDLSSTKKAVTVFGSYEARIFCFAKHMSLIVFLVAVFCVEVKHNGPDRKGWGVLTLATASHRAREASTLIASAAGHSSEPLRGMLSARGTWRPTVPGQSPNGSVHAITRCMSPNPV